MNFFFSLWEKMMKQNDKENSMAPISSGDQGVYANAMYDTAFKKIFQNKEIAMDLINSYIPERKIKDLRFTNVEMQGEIAADRRAAVDVICTDDKGREFVVEMQKATQKHFRERMIFYSSRIISSTPEAKEKLWNYDIPKVYVFAFTAFSFTDVIQNEKMNDTFVLNYVTTEKNMGDKMPSAPEYFFFDLKRFNKKIDEIAKSPEKWLYLLNNSSKLKSIPQEFKGDSAVETYFNISRLAAFSKDELEKYDNDMRNEWDTANEREFFREKGASEGFAKGKAVGKAEGIAEGKAVGIVEGKAEGKAERNLEVAKAMLSNGIAISVVSTCTGLTEEEIQVL